MKREMTLTRLRHLLRRLDALVVFRALLDDEVVCAMREVLSAAAAGDFDTLAVASAEFEYRLFDHGESWTSYLNELVMESENVCIRHAHSLTPRLSEALEGELKLLQELSELKLSDLPGAPDYLTGWATEKTDLAGDYHERMDAVDTHGYGVFARYHVFTVENSRLVPVRHPDAQTLEERPGYEREREKIVANTVALLEGRPANNVLLYGDAGTGKSSAVKAIANEYASRGLRLVEVKKNQLYQIPDLMDALAENPLKFILFIDDLSFSGNDDNFAALKAILEGSVGGRAGNLAVYATSNRRHLIKETLTDREGDDIHASDTRQELMSLSARFGLTITFSSPDRERYLYIVQQLAKQYGLTMDEKELAVRSEAFAIRAGGRSARVAKQFVELCKAGVLNA